MALSVHQSHPTPHVCVCPSHDIPSEVVLYPLKRHILRHWNICHIYAGTIPGHALELTHNVQVLPVNIIHYICDNDIGSLMTYLWRVWQWSSGCCRIKKKFSIKCVSPTCGTNTSQSYCNESVSRMVPDQLSIYLPPNIYWFDINLTNFMLESFTKDLRNSTNVWT